MARLALLGVALVFAWYAVRKGLPVDHAVRALLAITVVQLVPGVLVWRLVRGEGGYLLEDVVAGFAIGASLAIPGQVVAGLTGQSLFAWLPAVLVTVAVLAVPSSRATVQRVRTKRLPWEFYGALSLVCVPLLLILGSFYRFVPLSWPSGFRFAPSDVYFHLALVGQLAERGPTQMPFAIDEPLAYHWFSHAWVAHIGTTGGVPFDAVLFRVAPPLLALLLTFGVAIVTVRLSGRAWAGVLAAGVAVASVDVNIFGGLSPFTSGKLLTSSAISLEFSSTILVVAIALLASRWRGQRSVVSAVVLGGLTVAAAGSKGSSVPILLAGVGLTFAVAVLWRRRDAIAIGTDLAIVVGGFALVFLTIFGGTSRTTIVDPAAALRSAGISVFFLGPVEEPGVGLLVFGGLLVLFSVLARGAGLLGGVGLDAIRRDPVLPLLAGVSFAAAMAVVLFRAGGNSQYYFLRNGVPVMAMASGFGLAAAWDVMGRARERVFAIGAVAGLGLGVVFLSGVRVVEDRDPALAGFALFRLALLAAILAVFVVVALRVVESGRRVAAATTVVALALTIMSVVPFIDGFRRGIGTNGPVEPTQEFVASRDQIEAARWLRDHSDTDDLVITNRHCTVPDADPCDARRFLVSAFTERRVLLESWAYTLTAEERYRESDGELGRDAPYWNPELLDLNDSFLTAPTEEAADELRSRGVDWIYIDRTADWSPELEQFATLRHETEWAVVYEL